MNNESVRSNMKSRQYNESDLVNANVSIKEALLKDVKIYDI